MDKFNINRRRFLHTASATLAYSALGATGLDLIHPAQPYKVALIGTGWYGKSDLFRLIQVADVDVVADSSHRFDVHIKRVSTGRAILIHNGHFDSETA